MITVKLTKSQRAHVTALETDTEISEGRIRSLRKILNAQSFNEHGPYPGWIFEALEKREKTPLIITASQSSKGLEWLNSLRLTPHGRPRKCNPFTLDQETILDDFTHFTLADFVEVQETRYLTMYYTAYQVHSRTHGSFKYYAKPWQSRMADKSPLYIYSTDIAYADYIEQGTPKVLKADEVKPPFSIPFVGDADFAAWTRTKRYWFVDSSGFGAPDEPALMPDAFTLELKRYIMDNPSHAYGITETGQFQLYVVAFRPASEPEFAGLDFRV